jgi:hypothetical protein
LDVCKPEEWTVQYAEACKSDENVGMEMGDERADESNNSEIIEEQAATQTQSTRQQRTRK